MSATTVDIFIEDAFKESDHPRGQPNNAGQFTSVGGGSTSKGYKAPAAKTKFHVKPIGLIQWAANTASSPQEAAEKIKVVVSVYKHANVASYAKNVLKDMEKHHGLAPGSLGTVQPKGGGVSTPAKPAASTIPKPQNQGGIHRALYDLATSPHTTNAEKISVLSSYVYSAPENIAYQNSLLTALGASPATQSTPASKPVTPAPSKVVLPPTKPLTSTPSVVSPANVVEMPKPIKPNSQSQAKLYQTATSSYSNETKVQSIKSQMTSMSQGGTTQEYGEQLIKALGGTVPPSPTVTLSGGKLVTPENPSESWHEAMSAYASAYNPTHYDSVALSKIAPTATSAGWNKVSTNARNACIDYTGAGSSSINHALRNPEKASAHVIDSIHAIDDAFDSPMAKLSSDMIIRRNMDFDDNSKTVGEMLAALKQGIPARFQHDGFVSASSDVKPAFSGGSVNMEILVRKHTPALVLKPISGLPHENEVLLRHGQSCEVLSIQKIGYKYHIRVVTV